MRAPRLLPSLLGIAIILWFTGCGGGGAASSGTGSSGGNAVPSISSISPDSITVGSPAATILLYGSNFDSATRVFWNGAELTTTYVNSTELTAEVPATDLSAAANVQIAVSNGSTASESTPAPFLVKNPKPEIAAISPQAVTAGAPVTLTATGTYFLAGAQILWNGSPLNTTVLNSTMVTAQVPPSDLTAAATASITVSNPGPGGGASQSLPFIIYDGSTRMMAIPLASNDVAWDSTHGLIYASVPGANGAIGVVEAINPITAKVTAQVAAGSTPNQLSVNSDHSELWVGEDGTGSVQRFALPGLTPDLQFNLPKPNPYITQTAMSLRAAPDSPDTAAVLLGQPSGDTITSTGTVMIYDAAVPRSAELSGVATSGLFSLRWGADSSMLYGSDSAGLDVMNVNSAGVSLAKSIPRTASSSFHFDPSTGYLYSDVGQVWNPATGDLVGTFDVGSDAQCAVDSAQGLVFFVAQTKDSLASAEYTILVFDKSTYQLLGSLLVPELESAPGQGVVLGQPTQLFRWEDSGLAFTTTSAFGSTPMLFLVDGKFVNRTAAPDVTAGMGLDMMPSPSAVSPESAIAGSGGAAITITGKDFTPGAQVYWNHQGPLPCSPVQTTYVSPIELQAVIPACDLLQPGSGTIQVSNGTDYTLSATQFKFTILAPGSTATMLNLGVNDLSWDAKNDLLYAAVGSLDPHYPDSIVAINPTTGAVVKSQWVGPNPSIVRVTSDGAYVYVGYRGASAVTRLQLPGLNEPLTWSSRSDATSGVVLAMDIQPAPGASQTVAVLGTDATMLLGNYGTVTIFDNGVARSSSLTSAASGNTPSSLQWGADASVVYGAGRSLSTTNIGDLSVMNVDASGVTLKENDQGVLQSAHLDAFGTDINYDPGTGFLYSNDGTVVNPANAAVEGGYNSGGLVLPDSSLNTVFILGETYYPGFPDPFGFSGGFGLLSYNQKTYAPIATEPLPPDFTLSQPVAFVRCGGSCLAYAISSSVNFDGRGGMLYILHDPKFVTAAPSN